MEKKHYLQMKEQLEKESINYDSISHIVIHILKHRSSFKSILSFKVLCLSRFFPCCFGRRRAQDTYKDKMRYQNGVNRYFKELDIIKILKTIRASKLMFKSFMNTRERILLQMQRTQVVSSDSDDGSTSNEDVKDLGSRNPLVRVWALGRV